MKTKNISGLQFMIVSGLLLTVALALLHISELRWRQVELLESVNELREVQNINQEMADRLINLQVKIRELQEANRDLKEMLFSRALTYLLTVEKPFCDEREAALISRSGIQEPERQAAGLNLHLNRRSGLTAEDFERVWHAHDAAELKGIGKSLLRAEAKYGVNALLLAAVVVHESGWGESAIARDKNNLAGLGAFDDDPYNHAISFASKEDSIYFLARLLANEYMTPGGRFYNGSHLAGIGKRYATDPLWSKKVAGVMRLLVRTAVEDPEAMLSYIFARTD